MRIPAILLALTLAAASFPAAAAAPTGEKKKGGGESFLQFPAMTATVVRPSGRRGVLQVEAGLDVPDGGLRDRALASQPRLRDAYVRFLLTYAASVPPGAPPNPDAIGTALQRATDQVLGKPGARVLLGTILIN
jgi:hypothetical protein